MKAEMFVRRVWFVLLGLCVTLVQGQDVCPAIVEQALDRLEVECDVTGRNQACYGNVSIVADLVDAASREQFDQVGEIIDAAVIRSLKLSPMDEAAGTWGVALLRLQANIPDTLPGQNVTFLLFGDVELRSAVEEENRAELTPLQAFYLTSGLGTPRCDEAPESGLLVQTPEGVGEVSFRVNGVDIQMGSTVLFRAQAGGEMTISTLEGSAVLNFEGEAFPVVAGTWTRVPLDENLRWRDRPLLPQSYESAALRGLPLRALARRIEAHTPLNQQDLRVMLALLRRGEAPCGLGNLPDCRYLRGIIGRLRMARAERWLERMPDARVPMQPGQPMEDNRSCVFRPRPGDPPLPANETRPFCADVVPENALPPDTRSCVYRPGPNDPPLPANETRPFCPDPTPMPRSGAVPYPSSTPIEVTNRGQPVDESTGIVQDAPERTLGEVVLIAEPTATPAR